MGRRIIRCYSVDGVEDNKCYLVDGVEDNKVLSC